MSPLKKKILAGPKKKAEGPVWKTIKTKAPFCPKCNSPMTRVTNPDEATMYDWRCLDIHNKCNFVC